MSDVKQSSFQEEIKSMLGEAGIVVEDGHYSEDESWALLITTRSIDPFLDVKRSSLVVFIKGDSKKSGQLYDSHFQGDDFYYAEHKLAKILSVEQNGKRVVTKVAREKGEDLTFEFDLP